MNNNMTIKDIKMAQDDEMIKGLLQKKQDVEKMKMCDIFRYLEQTAKEDNLTINLTKHSGKTMGKILLDVITEKMNISKKSMSEYDNFIMPIYDVGTKMKVIETISKNIADIKEDESMIVRLDGVGFSTYTKSFTKPFDPLIVYAMAKTTEDMLQKFYFATTGYTHSDEITLIFPNGKTENGRMQKILTKMAGYCSARFNANIVDAMRGFLCKKNKNMYTVGDIKLSILINELVEFIEKSCKLTDEEKYRIVDIKIEKIKNMLKQLMFLEYDVDEFGILETFCNEYEKKTWTLHEFSDILKTRIIQLDTSPYTLEGIGKILDQNAIFDARALIFTDKMKDNITAHMYWRSMFDCKRNNVSCMVHELFSINQSMNKNTDDKIKMLAEKGIIWNDLPLWVRHGMYFKRTTKSKINNIEIFAFEVNKNSIDFLLAEEMTDEKPETYSKVDLMEAIEQIKN